MAPAIEVRDARPDDAEALVTLWREMAVGTGHQARLLAAPSVQSAEASVRKHALDPAGRLVVGEIDGVLGGMAYLRQTPISPLHDEVTVTVEYLHVSDHARRHGLGKALIAEAAAWAEHENCPHLAVVAPPVAREANRFLARLGLGQAGVLRFASTHTVRRRLAAEHAPNLLALLSSRRSVMARRAQLARSPMTGGHDDAEFGDVDREQVTLPAAPESAGK
ncbi:GNAT family N-acetyltransferase [Kribbella sp. CA-293567]|uniref:GNAT family N-acetyltransferase n=1 Tax=Kribbella sp. CA-293567 TaxID=3002436 RepID=UPI0022DE32EC|nr:GNAT family N-acetyltransferase [Kribbella sp. CA-293567]WBQ02392.1 GNAT family N-acetyltransferase [Kribbella sp. CA-293567]